MNKLRMNLEGRIKLSLSLALLIYSIVGAILCNNIIICIAMLLSSVGDICLLINRGCLTEQKKNTFNYGVWAFQLSHIVYILEMPSKYSKNLIIIILILLLTSIIIDRTFKNSKEAYICTSYAVILVFSIVNALNFSLLATFGMGLFIISDSILGICKIVGKRNMGCEIAIWTTYVLAQICLLTTIIIN